MNALRSVLRKFRYDAPDRLGALLPVASVPAAAAEATRLARRDGAVTSGYFAMPHESAEAVAGQFVAIGNALADARVDAILAVKAAPLDFDPRLLARIAATGIPLAFDALTPAQADATHDLAQRFGGTLALPARWRRSRGDAERLRDSALRLRLIKGEWADPIDDAKNRSAAFLELVRSLAGRAAPVAVATHDPVLAEAALHILRDAGTPVELEQLRGLPQHRTRAVAASLKVPVRPYTAWGPGWWPYAFEQALRRPYLPLWALRDRLGRPDPAPARF